MLCQVFEDVRQDSFLVRREFQSLVHGVKNPSEDEFACAPSSVTLEELLEGHSLIAMGFVSSGLGQHRVDGVEEMLA